MHQNPARSGKLVELSAQFGKSFARLLAQVRMNRDAESSIGPKDAVGTRHETMVPPSAKLLAS